ncbi:MAG: hypothetical protein FJ088_15785, partial [Deltaproteobacteria bacterium]|nr:hypothetical protein [Deltaproteobacteria bacterium]
EQIRFDQNAVRQMIGVKSKVLRVRAKGFMDQSASEITGVIDTQSARYIYWRE